MRVETLSQKSIVCEEKKEAPSQKEKVHFREKKESFGASAGFALYMH